MANPHLVGPWIWLSVSQLLVGLSLAEMVWTSFLNSWWGMFLFRHGCICGFVQIFYEQGKYPLQSIASVLDTLPSLHPPYHSQVQFSRLDWVGCCPGLIGTSRLSGPGSVCHPCSILGLGSGSYPLCLAVGWCLGFLCLPYSWSSFLACLFQFFLGYQWTWLEMLLLFSLCSTFVEYSSVVSVDRLVSILVDMVFKPSINRNLEQLINNSLQISWICMFYEQFWI